MPQPPAELRTRGHGSRRNDAEALEKTKRETSEAVNAFLEEAQDVADSGNLLSRLGLGNIGWPPQQNLPQQTRAEQRLPSSPSPSLPDAAGPPRPAQVRSARGEMCLDAFGASASEARHWAPLGGGPPAPVQPKRPPGSGGMHQPGVLPFDSEQSMGASSAGMSSNSPQPLHGQKRRRRPAPPLRAICTGPLGLYLVSALSFALLWQVWPLPSALTALGLVLALHSSLPRAGGNGRGRLGAGDLVPCGVCGCAAVLGALTGIYAHQAYTSPFYVVALGGEYHNVLASSPSAAYGDAGKLHFANSSAPDSSRVLGFQNQRRYCVAPVVDSGGGQTARVGFWAVGLDCCGYRAGFSCGDVGASSGARAPRDGLFDRRRTQFINAINQAAAVYGLQVDDDPILLHWVRDPATAQRTSLLAAFGVVFLGAAMFVLLTVATLAVTSMST